MIRAFFAVFIKVHIRFDLRANPGLWLIEELRHHGYALGPGAVEPPPLRSRLVTVNCGELER